MLIRIFRPALTCTSAVTVHIARRNHRRAYSAISTHSHFPATLLRINAGEVFKKFPVEHQDAEVSKDHNENADVWTNCIREALSKATLMPNTFKMQEIIRMAADYYLEDMETGVPAERPFIFTIPKGTPLPSGLLLLREGISQFSLESSQPTSPDALNIMLEDFYSENADKQDVDVWLDNHNYENAIADDNESEWMAR